MHALRFDTFPSVESRADVRPEDKGVVVMDELLRALPPATRYHSCRDNSHPDPNF
jgi:hypothetical protein